MGGGRKLTITISIYAYKSSQSVALFIKSRIKIMHCLKITQKVSFLSRVCQVMKRLSKYERFVKGLSRYERIVKVWKVCQGFVKVWWGLSRYERFVKVWRGLSWNERFGKGLSRYIEICQGMRGLSRCERCVKIWRVLSKILQKSHFQTLCQEKLVSKINEKVLSTLSLEVLVTNSCFLSNSVGSSCQSAVDDNGYSTLQTSNSCIVKKNFPHHYYCLSEKSFSVWNLPLGKQKMVEEAWNCLLRLLENQQNQQTSAL